MNNPARVKFWTFSMFAVLSNCPCQQCLLLKILDTITILTLLLLLHPLCLLPNFKDHCTGSSMIPHPTPLGTVCPLLFPSPSHPTLERLPQMPQKLLFPPYAEFWTSVGQIFGNSNIFKYIWTNIFICLNIRWFFPGQIYIWIFICDLFILTNIFGYSFVQHLW